jgi:hypothetical protein
MIPWLSQPGKGFAALQETGSRLVLSGTCSGVIPFQRGFALHITRQAEKQGAAEVEEFPERVGTMPDWFGLLMVLGFVTVVLTLYMVITRSAGIYATPRKFWLVLALSAGIAYMLSGSLFLFLHLNATIAVAVSAIVPFLVGNFDLGETSREAMPSDIELAEEQEPADDGEEEEVEDEEEGAIGHDISLNHARNDLI